MHNLIQLYTNRTTLYKPLHKLTTTARNYTQWCRTIQNTSQNCTHIQHSPTSFQIQPKLYKTIQDFTQLYTTKGLYETLQNFINMYRTSQRVFKQTHTRLYNTLQTLYTTQHNVTQFYTVLHKKSFTTCYNTVHNFTKLCNTLHKVTQFHKTVQIFYKHIQNVANLYTTKHNYTKLTQLIKYKKTQNCRTHYTTLHKCTQQYTIVQRPHTQNYIKLYNKYQNFAKTKNNCTKLYETVQNFTHTILKEKQQRLQNSANSTTFDKKLHITKQICTQLYNNFTKAIHNYTTF